MRISWMNRFETPPLFLLWGRELTIGLGSTPVRSAAAKNAKTCSNLNSCKVGQDASPNGGQIQWLPNSTKNLGPKAKESSEIAVWNCRNILAIPWSDSGADANRCYGRGTIR